MATEQQNHLKSVTDQAQVWLMKSINLKDRQKQKRYAFKVTRNY